MITFLDSIFDTRRYSSSSDIEQARLIYGFTTFSIVMFVLFAALVGFGPTHATLLQLIPYSPQILIAVVSVLGLHSRCRYFPHITSKLANGSLRDLSAPLAGQNQ